MKYVFGAIIIYMLGMIFTMQIELHSIDHYNHVRSIPGYSPYPYADHLCNICTDDIEEALYNSVTWPVVWYNTLE